MARPGFPVPDDVIQTGCGMTGWVRCTFYGDSITAVGLKRQKYIEKYPPQGYDTYTDGSINKHPDGYYFVKMKRWSSCD